MSDRRMFSKFIIDNDRFLDMPLTAQALYFHLGLCGDDEGFVTSPRRVMRGVGCTDSDLKALIANGFVIPFDSGVVVITHWNIHNSLRKDRLKATVFTAEREQLSINDSGAYYLSCGQLSTTCQPNDNQLSTNCPPNIIEYNLTEDKGTEESVKGARSDSQNFSDSSFFPPTVDEVKAYCTERGNSIDAETFVNYYAACGWTIRGETVKNWKALVNLWEKRENHNIPENSSADEYEDIVDLYGRK